MGFIYSKPLSIEGVFSKFDKDGNGVLSAEESSAAKNMAIFSSFNVRMDMTLETFENENRNTYAQYEQLSTRLFNEQKEKIVNWLQNVQSSSQSFREEEEFRRIQEMEKELGKKQKELESKLQIQKEASNDGINISPKNLTNWSTMALTLLLLMAKIPGREGMLIKNYLETP